MLSALEPSEKRKPLSALQNSAVYGPIHSRRLGYSLGINPLPLTYKFCDYDCVYCQYGWTPEKGNGEKIKRAPELLSEIRNSFEYHKKSGTPVNCLTIAGNGEPTLHPDFLEFTSGLCALRDELYPGVRIGILSDSSQAHRPEIRQALDLLDERYMKLDAGRAETVAKINKPRGNFDFDRTLRALQSMQDIVVQSLFMQGSFDNTLSEEVEEWIKAVNFVRPREVQVYTIDRGTPEPGLKKAGPALLREIAALCESRTGIRSVMF